MRRISSGRDDYIKELNHKMAVTTDLNPHCSLLKIKWMMSMINERIRKQSNQTEGLGRGLLHAKEENLNFYDTHY